MSQPVLMKVYGNLTPAGSGLARVINDLCSQCCPVPEEPVCNLAGDLLTISWEGIYFPVEDVAEVMTEQLRREQMGKLDLLDLENWRLTRYQFVNGETCQSSAPLNNVLDYSGH